MLQIREPPDSREDISCYINVVEELWESAESGGWRPSSAPRSDWPRICSPHVFELTLFLVNTLVSLPFPRSDQIEILLAFKNEFPILKCHSETSSWTSKHVNSFDGVEFDNKTGVVTELDLRGACLSGSLSANSSLFRLHHIKYLDLSFNYFDSSSLLPEFGNLTKLEYLGLSDMSLTGEIPSSISSLNRLTELRLTGNKLIGSFSPLFNLSKLSSLYLSSNHFSGNVPCSLLNLSKLSTLDLSSNHFSGNVPCSLLTMPFLSKIYLSQNHLIGSLETMNCSSSSKLEYLHLSYNRLSGRILEPLSKLTNLKELFLSFQNTTDPINFVSSLSFKSLESLDLIGNAISRLNIGSPNLRELYLDNCSINEFPTFIKNLQKLEHLNIANNRLKGEVPRWLCSMPSLNRLFLSHNSLDSFEGSPKMLLNSSLIVLDLRSNAFRGSLPVISRRLYFMLASNNSFEGDIPLSLCNQSDLGVIDLSHNNFSGSIPGCLITSAVEALNLRNNNLIGRFPDIFDKNGMNEKDDEERKERESASYRSYGEEEEPTARSLQRLGSHRIHGKAGGAGTKGMVAKLSIGVIVLLICTLSLLFSASIGRNPEPTRSSKINVVEELWESAESGGWRPSSAPRSDWPRICSPHVFELTLCFISEVFGAFQDWNDMIRIFWLLFAVPMEETNGYLRVRCNGGLNQQRSAVCVIKVVTYTLM
ncbi:hypothetical protein F2Q70_00042110 [Brassica cretica]|uniref:Disease resistance R13L4/SHOC-2-like LRR domain-containing protein n=1 Tax=Brassica cretica TaxID=69181 RepID=A0A8S9KEW3_BRACR|nr:hypothetical protein F2Q70_00042110 [Brassica cretica]